MNKFKKIRMASICGMAGNFFLFIIKALVGTFTNSKAMIVDAFNSLSDIISSLMTFIGNRIASRPQDEDHDLGHGKAEYIYSMIISFIMFILTINLIYSSVKSLFVEERYTYSPWLIAVCLVTILLKLALYFYTIKIAKEYNNLLIKANAIDHRNDCVLTFFNLLAAIMSSKGFTYVDGIVGLAIATWIFISAVQIFKNSYNVLMDKAINTETKNEVLALVQAHEEVIKIEHFISTPIGYLYQISFTIFVDGSLSTFESHAIAEALEDEIKQSIPEIYLTVIHVNPVHIKKKNTKKSRCP